MLGLRINDIAFPLPAGFTIPYELVTNVLNLQSIEPSFALPITLPATDELKAFFGHPHELQSAADLSTVYEDAAILVDDNIHWQGIVELVDAGNYTYRIHFRMASGFLTTLLSGTKLREVFEGDSITLDGETFNVHTIEWVTWPKDDYRVYINGALFNRSNTTNDPVATLNLLAADLATHASITSATFDAGTYKLVITTVPGANLAVTAETFKAANSSSGPFEPDIEVPYDQTLPMTVTSLERTRILFIPGNGAFVLPVMHLPSLYEDKVPNYTGFVNVQKGGEFLYDKPVDPADITTTIVPCIMRRYIITELCAKYNIELKGYFGATSPATVNSHEFVPRPIDKEMYASVLPAAFQISIPLADLLPDVTVGEWLQSWKFTLAACSTVSLTGKTLTLTSLNVMLAAQPRHDWSQYLVKLKPLSQDPYKGFKLAFGTDSSDAEISNNARPRADMNYKGSVILEADLTGLNGVTLPGEVYYVQSRNAYFIRTVAGWSFHSHNLDAATEGEGAAEISTVYQPLPDTLQTVDGQTMLMPVSQVVGYSAPLGLDSRDWTPRFSTYLFSQQAQQGAYYYMSSIGSYKASGGAVTHVNGYPANISPTLSLAYHPNGLDQSYASYLGLIKKLKRAEGTFHLPRAVLASFGDTDKVTVNGVNFLIEKITSQLSSGGLGVATVEMVKVQ